MSPPPRCILSNSLIETCAELRNNPLHSDVRIISENSTYYGHKVILYGRSKKWGQDKTLAGTSILNWTKWSDQTIKDILDFVYLDRVTFLEDDRYDDLRTIKLMSAATYFSLDHLVTLCEESLQKSKDRYILPPDSIPVLTEAALQISAKNFKQDLIPTSKRSLLKVRSTVSQKRALAIDTDNDHFYGLPKQQIPKRRCTVKAKHLKNIHGITKSTEPGSSLVSQPIIVNGVSKISAASTTSSPGLATDKTPFLPAITEETSSSVSSLHSDSAVSLSSGTVGESPHKFDPLEVGMMTPLASAISAVPRTDVNRIKCDVSGSVLTAPSGSPVSGAQVTLTAAGKKFTVVSDTKGNYQLESITSATYTISVTSPSFEFSPVTANVSPSSPVLPVIAASRYQVIVQLDYSTVAHDAARRMIISSKKGTNVVTVDKTGKFSTMLPSDTYALSIKSTLVDEQKGIVFAPVSLNIDIKEPITDLYFFPASGIASKNLYNNKKIFHTLFSRKCNVGDIEGAGNVLLMMLYQRIKISEKMFKSRLTSAIMDQVSGVRCHGVSKVMKRWELFHSLLTCIYASAGDWKAVERIINESHSQGIILGDDETKELSVVMSIVGHEDKIEKLLSLAILTDHSKDKDNLGALDISSMDVDSLGDLASLSVARSLLANTNVDKPVSNQ